MNKKAMELAVNFIVILIISIVVFGMGLYFLKGFFGFATEQTEQLDINTEKMIQNILLDGSKVAVPLDKKTVNRGSSAVFGVGILNILGDKENFSITLNNSLIIDKQGVPVDISPLEDPYLEFLSDYSRIVEANEQAIISIPIRVSRGAKSGTYIVDLDVYAGNSTEKYFNTVQLTVKVN